MSDGVLRFSGEIPRGDEPGVARVEVFSAWSLRRPEEYAASSVRTAGRPELTDFFGSVLRGLACDADEAALSESSVSVSTKSAEMDGFYVKRDCDELCEI